jgi:hypothetical protein
MGSIVSDIPDSYMPQMDDGDMFIYPDGPLAAYFMGTVYISGDPGTTGPIVTSIDPSEGWLDFEYPDVEIQGENFVDGATIQLVKNDDPGVVIDATDIMCGNEQLLYCTLNLDGIGGLAEVGLYDVVVTNPDMQEGTLENGFEVLDYPCAPNEWGDNFDSYTPGTYPIGWVNFWSGNTAGTYVTTEQYYSPPNSFRQSAYTNWARYDGLPFMAGDKTYVCYEGRLMLTHAGRGGIIGFAWKKTSSTTGHYAANVIREPTFTETYHWYHILAKINMTDHTWRVWVDDVLWKDGTACGTQDSHDSFTHFIIGMANFPSYPGTGVVYWDDVYLYWED